MSLRCVSLRPSVLPLTAIMLIASGSLLLAQGSGRPLFEWNGRVDREIQIAMRGREAWVQANSRTDNARARPHVSSALPRTAGTVRVRLEDGRGNADVIQQPSSRNDFTAVVRVRDRSGGADSYRVNTYWIGSDNGRDDASDSGWDRPGRGRGGRDPYEDRNGGWGRGRDRFGQNVLRWSGQVDDGLEIRIQGDRISYRNLSGKGTRDVHADLPRNGIPRENVELRVREREGRGDVYIVQQPNRWNGYTALIRVYDPRPSFGFYDFDVTWRPTYASRW